MLKVRASRGGRRKPVGAMYRCLTKWILDTSVVRMLRLEEQACAQFIETVSMDSPT